MMSEHAKAQVLRFLRVLGYALAVQAAGLQHWPGWAGLWALAPAAGETVLRELLPVRPLPAISSVLAPAAGPGLGLPEIPAGTIVSWPQTAPGTPGGTPLQGIDVPRNADGTFGPATIGSPPPGAGEK